MTRLAVLPADALAINGVLASSRQAIDAVCDRWTLSLVLAMLRGETRFGGLMVRTGIASRLLTARLRALAAEGLILSMPYSMHPPRLEYRLTIKGADLADVIVQMLRWEVNWGLAGPGASSIVHRSCGATLHPDLRCAACGVVTGAREIRLKLSRSQLQKAPRKQMRHRRSIIDSHGCAGTDQVLGPSLDVFGDKWGIEILLCAFSRVRRFNEFRACTGIAPNILADRLERFVAAGILRRDQAPASHPRYSLSEKGIDIYGVLVSVERWADAWLRARYRSPVRLIHTPCGKVFRPLTGCTTCGGLATKETVAFGRPEHAMLLAE
jgi:DNA-binding HxlR family transcriptional regulator